MLQPRDVVIPYAAYLSLPTANVASRRVYSHVVGIIKAVALLRQYQKPPTDGSIEADVYDYTIAHQVLAPILQRIYSPVRESARQLLDTIRQHAIGQQTFSRKDCEGWSGLKISAVRQRLNELVDAGLLVAEEGRRGAAYRYRLAPNEGPAPSQLAVLITPAELQQRLVNQANVNGQPVMN